MATDNKYLTSESLSLQHKKDSLVRYLENEIGPVEGEREEEQASSPLPERTTAKRQKVEGNTHGAQEMSKDEKVDRPRSLGWQGSVSNHSQTTTPFCTHFFRKPLHKRLMNGKLTDHEDRDYLQPCHQSHTYRFIHLDLSFTNVARFELVEARC